MSFDNKATPFTICAADCRGNAKQKLYPHKKTISSVEDLKQAVTYDHVMAEYKNSHRKKAHFIKSSVLSFDCDNTHSDNSDEWKTTVDVQSDFPGVTFYVVYSRNHMKEKNGKSPRPKFHVYFPVEEYTDGKIYARHKTEVINYWPFFDIGAKDAARFFFGVENPQVEFFPGTRMLSDFMRDVTAEHILSSRTRFRLPKVIVDGERDDTLFRYACSLRSQGFPGDGILAKLREVNDSLCEPPMEDWELIKITKSAAKYEPGTTDTTADSGKNETQAQLLLSIAESIGAEYFRSDTGDLFAAIPVNEHREISALDSKGFSTWIQRLYYKKVNRPVGSEAVKQALAVLMAKAQYDCETPVTLHTRVAGDSREIWYDLSNEKWQTVRITPEKWEIVDNPPLMFRRYKHQKAQITPIPGGDVRKILNHVNLKGNEVLFLCWLISCFVPSIPHAMPIFYGEKGAAKSTACEFTKAVIDPSTLETLTLQNDPRTLVVNFQQHWYLAFDNVSYINADTSDALCRAITGGGIQQRKLHTNEEDVIFSFRRCLAVNGINNAATRPDLLDRSILLELQRLSESERRELSEIKAAFEADLPAILGGIFDTLSKAMVFMPFIVLDKLPRMADFTKWGYAIGEALGKGLGQNFLSEYADNRQTQNDEAIANDTTATLIVELMRKMNEQKQEKWEDSVAKLLAELKQTAWENEIVINNKKFPQDPTRLSKKIRAIRSNLEAVGINIKFLPRTKEAQKIELTRPP